MRKMEKKRKEELQIYEHRVYGMNGVGKQTYSIPYSIKRCVIKRVVDGKGIGRRVNQNPSTREAPKKKGESAPICCTTLLRTESLLEELKVW